MKSMNEQSEKIVELLMGLATLVKQGIDDGREIKINLEVKLAPKNDVTPPEVPFEDLNKNQSEGGV